MYRRFVFYKSVGRDRPSHRKVPHSPALNLRGLGPAPPSVGTGAGRQVGGGGWGWEWKFYLTEISSTSKMRVLLGGMVRPAPRSP